jgi:hypothetical protein
VRPRFIAYTRLLSHTSAQQPKRQRIWAARSNRSILPLCKTPRACVQCPSLYRNFAALFLIARQTGIGLGVRLGKNGRDRVDQTGADTELTRALDIGRPAFTTRAGKAHCTVQALVRPRTRDQTPQCAAGHNGRQARVLAAINAHIRPVGTGSARLTMQNFGASCSWIQGKQGQQQQGVLYSTRSSCATHLVPPRRSSCMCDRRIHTRVRH